MAEADRLEIGRINKSHGLRGEVVVDFVTNLTEQRTAPGARMWAADQALVVASARPHQQKWLVRFEGVDGREQADLLRGLPLTAEPIEDDDVVFVHELIGRRLVDQHGTSHGSVKAVVENPASDLLELDDGRLVPLAFYVDHDDEVLTVDVPIGLLDDGALESEPGKSSPPDR